MRYPITTTILDQAAYTVAKTHPELNQSMINDSTAVLIQLEVDKITKPLCRIAERELIEFGIDIKSHSGQQQLGQHICMTLLAYEWIDRPE